MIVKQKNDKVKDKDKKPKKPYTTKRLIVPGKYVLECIANDRAIPYPVTVTVVQRNGGTSYILEKPEDVIGLSKSGITREATLIRARKKEDGAYIDLRKEGYLTVDIKFLPELRNNSTLFRPQAKEVYNFLLYPECSAETAES